MRKTWVLAILLLGSLCSAATAQAPAYPSQTIKVIVPYVPGGPIDAIARVVMQQVQGRLGQTIVIENKAGGGTTIGAKAVAVAEPDGHTLLLMAQNLAYYPVLFPGLDFDPMKNLTPVAPVVTWWHVFGIAPAVPAKTIPEFVAHAKANPGKLAFGYGLATMPHILGEVFQQAAGIDMINVPYRGGEGARADLLGGRIHLNVAPVPQMLPLLREGKMRALAYTGPRRSPDLPDVPTMTESGYPQVGFNPDVWLGIFAPAGTPAAVVDKLNREVGAVMMSDEMAPHLKRFGYEAKTATPAEFTEFVAAELKKWPPVLKATGLQPQ